MTKQFISLGLLSIAGFATTLAPAHAASLGGTQPSCVTISRSLPIGATGADVRCLQQALIAAGYSIPAGATGYFGSQTRAAVSAWQTAHHISPPAGYFGPISRAAWNLVGSTTVSATSVCGPGALFNIMTGLPCTSISGGGSGGGGGSLSTGPTTGSLTITPEQCGAVGDGKTNDTTAVNACASRAAGVGIPLSFDKAYRITSSIGIGPDVIFDDDAMLDPDSNVTVTLQGLITASQNAQIFGGTGSVIASTAPLVSVAWWGAMTAHDAGPAFMAAGGSNRTIYIPPATYTFNSTPYRPYQADNPYAVLYQNLSNVSIEGTGATIAAGTALKSQYGLILFDRDNQLKVTGLSALGNMSDFTPTTQNVAFSVHSLKDFTFRNITLAGNWGGYSSAFIGDYLVNGTFDQIKMDHIGICFDVAFMKNMTFSSIRAIGSDSGSGSGYKCLSNIYDVPSLGTNYTGTTLDDTDGVTVTDSDISNFQNPIVLTSGGNYTFTRVHVHDNPGTAVGGNCVYIYYNIDPPFVSIGFPVHDVLWDTSECRNNGTAVPGVGFYIGAHTITNNDQIRNITITHSTFDNNRLAAIGADTASHLSNIIIDSSNIMSGSQQTTQISSPLSSIISGWYPMNLSTIYTPRGAVDSSTCSTISGWAQDQDVPDSPIDVHIYFDKPPTVADFAGYVGKTTADQWRADMCIVIGSCYHAYYFSVPSQYKDGRLHTVYVYGIDSDGIGIHSSELGDSVASARTFQCSAI